MLSTHYPLRLTGKKIIALYNDKRVGQQLLDGKMYHKLPYWHVAYQEVSKALDSCDEGAIARLAVKYRTNYVVAGCDLEEPQWRVMVYGRRVSLYRFIAGAGHPS